MMELSIHDDFDLNKIADSGQCFRWMKEESGAFRILHRGHCLRIRALGEEKYMLSCSEEEYRDVWYDYFDFGEDYRAIRERIRPEEDPFLDRAARFGKGIRILRQDPFEALISFVISQNKNIPAIKKSIEFLCEAAGRRITEPEGAWHAFPSPEEILALTDEQLAACKLGYRCGYVRAAASDVAEGKLNLARLAGAPGPETIRALTAVYGVGVKVANCVSLFGLHHVDAFPVDVWIRRILEKEYPGGYPMEKYSPYNGIYQQYMFYCCRGTYGREKP